MPNDLRITTAPSFDASSEAIGNLRPPAAVAAPAQPAAIPANPTPNPTLELNPSLGLVVIQFHNDSGAITRSIPSQQQIDAYRLWQETKVGPPPNLGGGVPVPDMTAVEG